MYPLGRFLAIALLAGGAAGCNPKPANAMDVQTVPSTADCKTEAEITDLLKTIASKFEDGMVIEIRKPEKVAALTKLWIEFTAGPIPGVVAPDHIEAVVSASNPNVLVVFLQDGKTCQPGPASMQLKDFRNLLDKADKDHAVAPAPASPPATPVVPTFPTAEAEQDPANKPTGPNPFDGLKITQGEKVPDLKCMKRAVLAAQIKAHDGSELVKMTHDQFMFYKGFYAGLDFTSNIYPLGDSAVFSAHATTNKDGKAALEGLAAIEMGDTLVCNVTPMTETPMMDLFKAAGGDPGE